MEPARRESWDWLLTRLREHSRVASFEREGRYVIRVRKTNGRKVVIFFCNEYMVSLESLDSARVLVPEVDAVVTSSQWNRYSREAKEEGKRLNIGVFKGPEILGALWKDGADFVQYLSREQRAALDRGEDPY